MSDPQTRPRYRLPKDPNAIEQAVYEDLSDMTDAERGQAYHNSPTVRACVNKWRLEE